MDIQPRAHYLARAQQKRPRWPRAGLGARLPLPRRAQQPEILRTEEGRVNDTACTLVHTLIYQFAGATTT